MVPTVKGRFSQPLPHSAWRKPKVSQDVNGALNQLSQDRGDMGKRRWKWRRGVTALHSVHSHVFRGVVIVAGSNLARSHGCVRALVCHSRMSSLGGARKNSAFRVHLLDHGTARSGPGEEKHPCFSAKAPEDVFIIKPPPPPPFPIHQ